MSTKLTIKRANYANNLFLGMKQRPAYIKAGYSDKGRSSTIDRNACELAKNSTVVARLAELRAKAEDDSIAKVTEIKKEFTKVLRARLGDVAHLSKDKTQVIFDEAALESPAVAYIRTENVVVGRGDEAETVRVTRVSMTDKIRAGEALAKLHGAYDIPSTLIDQSRKILNIIVEGKEMEELIEKLKKGEIPDAGGHIIDQDIQREPDSLLQPGKEKSTK